MTGGCTACCAGAAWSALMPGDDEIRRRRVRRRPGPQRRASGATTCSACAASLAGRYGDGRPHYLSACCHELRMRPRLRRHLPGPVHLVGSERLLAAYARSPRSDQVQRHPEDWPRTACTPYWLPRQPARGASPPPPADAMAHGPALPHRTAPPPAPTADGVTATSGVVRPPPPCGATRRCSGSGHDVAGLAVHAVGEVDLQARPRPRPRIRTRRPGSSAPRDPRTAWGSRPAPRRPSA